jgi:leucyl aminopeptidase
MSSLLPDAGSPAIRALPRLPTDRDLAGLDALLLLIPVNEAPPRGLPDPGRWRALHQQRKPRHGDVRVSTLGGPRDAAAVLGYCRVEASPFEVLTLAGKLLRQALALRPLATRVGVLAPPPTAARRRLWQEGLYAAASAHGFSLPTLKSRQPGDPRDPGIRRVEIYAAAAADHRRWQATAEAGNLVRHLTALPPNVLDAPAYRRALATLARRHGLRLRWYGESALRRLGAGAFLAVSRGNALRDAGIAHLRYRPRARRAGRPDATLVGKGILFDTGGTNLKPHRSMLDMHTDMSGSAVAVATLVALARMKAPLAADAWLGITENSIGPKSYRPQEIVRAANGTSIQVIHSDAEGRMVLADTLHLATRAKPRIVLDFATLTGACVYALTERLSGVFTNREELGPQLTRAGHASGERVWLFPLDEDFDSDIESSVADVAQCAVEGKGDHIHAARFLKRFVPDATPWVHVDLSSATRRGGLAHVPTEITGFGVRFALSLLLDQARPA